jgi:hypothetical protein
MARAGFTPYDEQIVDTFDDDADRFKFESYQPTRSLATREHFLPEEPIPLFLSSQIGELQGRAPGKIRERSIVSALPLKTSILAAAAAVLVLSVLSVENPLTLFANAKASLLALSAAPSSTRPPAPTVRSTVEAPTLPVIAREAPTRDEIAAAFKAAAQQSQPEIRQPPMPMPAAPPVRRLNADELAILMKRAKSLIAMGDIAPARLLLERAADAQEASAALLLAQTYDPAVLGTQDSRSITPDPAMARDWYEKAAQFGSAEAQQRLAQMQN